jgi:hypothetical protein
MVFVSDSAYNRGYLKGFEEIRETLGCPALFIDACPAKPVKHLIEISAENDVGLNGFRYWSSVVIEHTILIDRHSYLDATIDVTSRQLKIAILTIASFTASIL